MSFVESRRHGKDIPIEEVVAEFPFGIVLLAQFNKIRQFFVAGTELFWTYCEQLSPVRTNIERPQFSFDDRKQLAHSRPILFPSEVNGHTRFFITRTHPEIVGGDAHTACTPKLVAIGFSASSKAASTSLDTAST